MIESSNPSALRSQREITEALLALMHQYPYNDISVKQILIESKLARKTFYRNFESKDDVLLSIVRKDLKDYFGIVDGGSADVLSTIFSFVEKNREMLILLEKNDMLHVVLNCMNEYLLLHKTGTVSADNPFVGLFKGLDSEYLIALNIGAIWNVISCWVRQGMKDDPEYLKDTIAKYLKRLYDLPAGTSDLR
ncbi:MAG: TetR/AcrR family transcriptional regulator [Lachnospiraceae bacterium]|nr:TetR/AcrR family transcriptional regulator [Lachnospiraceae bacterium]